jgi:hypothetical protein
MELPDPRAFSQISFVPELSNVNGAVIMCVSSLDALECFELRYIKAHWPIGNGFKITPATLSLYSEILTFSMCTKLMLSVDWKIYMAFYLQVWCLPCYPVRFIPIT